MKDRFGVNNYLKRTPNLRILRFNQSYTEQREILERLNKPLSGGYRYPGFVQPIPVY